MALRVKHSSILGSLLCLWSSQAHALTEQEIAARRALIDRASAAQQQGDHRTALALAEQAARIETTPSLRMFLAQELAANEQFARALGASDQCLRELRAAPTTTNSENIRRTCDAIRISSLTRVGSITVRVAAPPPGMTITVNGAPLAASLVGVPTVVDAGAVVIDAAAPGMRPFHRELAIARAATIEVDVVFEAEPTLPNATPTNVQLNTTHASNTGSGSRPPLRVGPPPPRRSALSVPAVIVTAAGGATLVGAAVVMVLRADALGRCTLVGDQGSCPTQADADRANRDHPTLTTVANVLFPVGIALTVGGGTWVTIHAVTSARPAERAALQEATVRVGGVF